MYKFVPTNRIAKVRTGDIRLYGRGLVSRDGPYTPFDPSLPAVEAA